MVMKMIRFSLDETNVQAVQRIAEDYLREGAPIQGVKLTDMMIAARHADAAEDQVKLMRAIAQGLAEHNARLDAIIRLFDAAIGEGR